MNQLVDGMPRLIQVIKLRLRQADDFLMTSAV
jgi:hypothetical protein